MVPSQPPDPTSPSVAPPAGAGDAPFVEAHHPKPRAEPLSVYVAYVGNVPCGAGATQRLGADDRDIRREEDKSMRGDQNSYGGCDICLAFRKRLILPAKAGVKGIGQLVEEMLASCTVYEDIVKCEGDYTGSYGGGLYCYGCDQQLKIEIERPWFKRPNQSSDPTNPGGPPGAVQPSRPPNSGPLPEDRGHPAGHAAKDGGRERGMSPGTR
jgi:hypothetical protein